VTSRYSLVKVSLMPLGAVSASLVAGRLLNTLGRKLTIQLTALAFTAGSLLMAFAPSLGPLLLGRFVVGFAVSLSAMSECLYISEMADKSNRGMLITLNELGITVGFLLAYLVNYIFMSTPAGWRVMFGLSAGLAVIQAGFSDLDPPFCLLDI
jgi:MFS family permease